MSELNEYEILALTRNVRYQMPIEASQNRRYHPRCMWHRSWTVAKIMPSYKKGPQCTKWCASDAESLTTRHSTWPAMPRQQARPFHRNLCWHQYQYHSRILSFWCSKGATPLFNFCRYAAVHVHVFWGLTLILWRFEQLPYLNPWTSAGHR